MSESPDAACAPLTTGEVAARLGVKPQTVRNWAESGQLRGFRLPGNRGHWRFDPAVVDEVMRTGLPQPEPAA